MDKKTVRRVVIIALAVLLVEQIFFLICGFGLPAQYGDTFMGELKSKYERLKETPGQRIVLAGGSGVAFDCDSEMIDEIFPSYEVVNFGMYAGLGTKAVMDLSEAYIREGDIVILSPEQSEQTLSDYFNGEYMWQAADGAFGMLRHIKSENFEVMLGNFPGFALEKLNYVWKGKNPPTDSVYQKKSFNTYGDIDLDTCQKNILPGGYDVNQKVRFTEDVVQPEFLEYMNVWAERLEKKGAAVWYRYCPVNELAVEDADDLKSYDVFLRQKLDFPVIGNPKNSLMEAEWFFDTNFHLNQAGKEVNTVQLIRDIKAMLGDDRTVNVELPEKPHRTWEDISTETRIWTARDSEAYQGEETIVIPENVTQIGDYAFRAAQVLRQSYLNRKILRNVSWVSTFWMAPVRRFLFHRCPRTVINETISGQHMRDRFGKTQITQKNKPTTFKRNPIRKIMIQCRYDKSETINFELRNQNCEIENVKLEGKYENKTGCKSIHAKLGICSGCRTTCCRRPCVRLRFS